MSIRLFDILDPKIFTVFSRADRNANYDLLSYLYDIFTKHERKQYISKDEVVDLLSTYIQERSFGYFENEEGEDIASKSAKDKAILKIRQFKRTGWLEEDTDESHQFSLVYSLNDNALILLQTFGRLIDKTNEPLEYTGYFYSVDAMLKDFSYDRSKALIEQIYKTTTELFDSLRGLSSSIKRFIEELMNREDMTPQDVLDTLLYKYQNQVILTVFNNLKGKDNPSKYTSAIIAKLKELRYENLEKITNGYFKSANDQALTVERYQEVEEILASRLDECISKFESVDQFVALIDRRNSKFHTSAIAKLNFLMNTRRDINGLLDMALKSLKIVDPSSDFSEIISLESNKQLDEKSAYSRSFDKEKVSYYSIDIPEVDEEEIEKEAIKIFLEDEYSKEKIDKYVMDMLADRDSISSRDISITNDKILLIFLMIQLYSEYKNMSYEIVLNDTLYEDYGYLIKEFEVIRRKKL